MRMMYYSVSDTGILGKENPSAPWMSVSCMCHLLNNTLSSRRMVVLNFATTEQTQLYLRETVIESYFRENFKHGYKHVTILIILYM